jgi:DNA-binding transcriptional regulator YbjK
VTSAKAAPRASQEKRRQELVLAAFDLIAEHGFEGWVRT